MNRKLRTGLVSITALVLMASGIPAVAADAAAGAPDSAAQGLRTIGKAGWQVASSADAPQGGAEVSSPQFATKGWLPVRPDDAGAPGTEIGALVQNGACPNVFYSDNMRKCFGYQAKRGPVETKRFAVPWWFRTTFTANPHFGGHHQLVLDGVVGEADIWLNGKKIADRSQVSGAFAEHRLDVSGALRPGANSLAVRMYPNDPQKQFTLSALDWSQLPPDNQTGIELLVQLRTSGPVAIGNSHVLQHNAADLHDSELTVRTEVSNASDRPQRAMVTARVSRPRGAGAPISLHRAVLVPPRSTRQVGFTPADERRLRIEHPRIWWPYRMGGQPLYTVDTAVAQYGRISNSEHQDFGIRTVTSKLVGKSKAAPHGVRQYSINGRPFVVRGGGFGQDLLLHYSRGDIAHQFALMKNMGINLVRLEGHEMPPDFYRQADRAGMLIESGFLCCVDSWQPPEDGSGLSERDYAIMHRSARSIGERLRSHPSVITYTWSDNAPPPRQEKESLAGFAEADFDVPFIASSEYKSSPELGPAGEKEGPYDWVPPNYWYDRKHFDTEDSSLTNAGGAWGFDSEQSAGNTVPTLDSLKSFLSPEELRKLWTDPEYHQYHNNYESGHDGYAFGTLYHFDTALAKRYGKWNSLESYVRAAQVQNYENTRAQFEAFLDHSTDKPVPATGTIYWQLNKGWPSLLWTLYGYDGDQAGGYFGAQAANRPLHALYTQNADGADSVTVDNLTGKTARDLSVHAVVRDLHGTVLDDQRAEGLTLQSQGVRNSVLAPKTPEHGVYFVELRLERAGKLVDRNVYWRSADGKDTVDWGKTLGNPQATMTGYADLSALHDLPKATVSAQAHTRKVGDERVTTVTLRNTSPGTAAAFFLRADLRDSANGSAVPQGIWSGNEVTLWPGQSQRIQVSYSAKDLRGSPEISIGGWNTVPVTVR
ncbi:glycoside hydrolase family 2 protein [Sciscionella marina]|uniref:glycoside hydrolase family 2 protein n=1 Tax=Sciscionella marina TaxID=508770 RepID=UPI0003756D40|nr:hypothetical protein [Sciscionella marina]